MAHSAGSQGAPHRSWRDQRADAEMGRGTRRVLRWLTTTLAVGLLALFVWIIWPPPDLVTHLRTLTVADYGVLGVPPMSFAREDAQALSAEYPHSPYLDTTQPWPNLDRSDSIQTLGDVIANDIKDEDNVFLLYVAAHGVSANGQPFVLCSDVLNPVQPASEGRYPLSDLLQAVAGSPAGRKLILLDCGRLATDSWFGMMVNDFPSLLEEEIKKVDDDNLWVIASSAPREVSYVSYPRGHSTFGFAIRRGLSYEADLIKRDENGEFISDGFIDLDELFEFIRTVVASQVNEEVKDGGASQTVRLLRGTVGEVTEIPTDLHLLSLEQSGDEILAELERAAEEANEKNKASKSAAAIDERRSAYRAGWLLPMALFGQTETKQETPPELPKAEDSVEDAAGTSTPAPPTDVSAGEPGPSAGAQTATATPPPSQTPPLPDDPRALNMMRFQRAWEIIEAIESRSGDSFWSPVDFAPHVWRELKARLIGSERWVRPGGGRTFNEIEGDLVQLTDALIEFQSALNSRNPYRLPARENRESVQYRLGFAWNAFLVDEARNSYEQITVDDRNLVDPLLELIQLRNDLLHRASALVRWRARAAVLDGQALPIADDIKILLDNLAIVSRNLYRWQSEEIDSLVLDEVARVTSALQRHSDEIARQLGEHVNIWLDRPTHPVNGRRASDLLESTLPMISDRRRLLEIFLQPPSENQPLAGTDSRAPQPGQKRVWEALSAQLDLEEALLAAADGQSSELHAACDTFRNALSAGATDEIMSSQAELVGRQLMLTYRDLPAGVQANVGKNNLRAAQSLLHLIDPRDARRLDNLLPAIPVPAFEYRSPSPGPQIAFTTPPPDSIDLTIGEAAFLDVAVQLTGESASGAGIDGTLIVDFMGITPDERRSISISQVFPDGRTRELRSPRIPLPLQADVPAPFRFAVRTTQEARKTISLSLRAVAYGAKGTQTHTVQLNLPPPNNVDLVVSGTGSLTSTSGNWKLQPHPNRHAVYVFSLRNGTGQDVQAAVELYSVRRPANVRLLPGMLLRPDGEVYSEIKESVINDATQAPLRGGETRLIAETAEPITLPADGSTVVIPFPPTASPDPPIQPPDSDAPDPTASEIAITDGLLFLIRDAGDGGKVRWTKWTEIRPLLPKDYVRPSVTYQRPFLNARIQATSRELFPRVTARNPVQVNMALQGFSGTVVGNLSGTMANATTEPLLNVRVEEAGGVTALLDVDGCPRAFAYALGESIADSQTILPIAGRSDVRIVSPANDDAFLAGTDIRVHFQVDAPDNAFVGRQSDDVVELTFFNERNDALIRRQYFSDRSTQVLLTGIAADGSLLLRTVIDDFRDIPLDTRGMKNQSGRLVARLEVGGNSSQDVVSVHFDGSEPEIERVIVASGNEILPGEPVELVVEVSDNLSGVKQVELAWEIKKQAGLGEQPKVLTFVRADGRPWPSKERDEVVTFAATLETGDLEADNAYRLLLRVTDNVGLATELPLMERPEIRVRRPEPPPPKPEDQPSVAQPVIKNGSVSGTVFGPGQRRVRGATVELTADGKKLSATTNSQGQFTIQDVPPGRHTLNASGIVSGVTGNGSASVNLRSGQRLRNVNITF